MPDSPSAWYFHAYTRAAVSGHVIATPWRLEGQKPEPNQSMSQRPPGRGGGSRVTGVRLVVILPSCNPPSRDKTALAWQ